MPISFHYFYNFNDQFCCSKFTIIFAGGAIESSLNKIVQMSLSLDCASHQIYEYL